ncbi:MULTISPECIES: protein DnrP [unclassified Pseudomonas]|uniref:protein DnrP n=1 Tax=unclassified Pseudomonas TaxID=196821 RepID=UPI0010549BCA|nr:MULTISPECIES: protein DnrP [unclassified Pseudomonas]KAA0947875.1 protein DnrP [Pseudomonas sp. ANT_H4]KAA0947952.1 protein DnrP [Pseudomonas sp. ANT_H14]
MRVCLYCQHPNAVDGEQCERCSMALPACEASVQARKLKRFQWFCLGLTLFCIVMFFWLPRDFY